MHSIIIVVTRTHMKSQSNCISSTKSKQKSGEQTPGRSQPACHSGWRPGGRPWPYWKSTRPNAVPWRFGSRRATIRRNSPLVGLCSGPSTGYIVPDLLRNIGFVTLNVAPFNLKLRKQINGRTCVMYLTAGEYKLDRITQSIDNSMGFCGLSTPAVFDKLDVFRIYSPLCVPALCGCALIEVLSMRRFS